MNESAGFAGEAATLFGRPVGQVGIVVRDLERSARKLSRTLGAGPWRVFTYSGEILTERTYRGEPGEFAVRIALNPQTPMIELLEPLEGPSIYHEWLDRHGEGLHHLAFWVESLDDAIESMARAGYPLLQSGRGFGASGDGGFAYFDTEADLGVIYEAVEPPSDRREPEAVIE
jgi:catechol 2,3-dioxygenase-like lactoylglutathione lyase family enzyme